VLCSALNCMKTKTNAAIIIASEVVVFIDFGVRRKVVGEVGMRAVDYEECIGAKKHLVTSPHIPSASPLRGSTSYVAAEYVHW